MNNRRLFVGALVLVAVLILFAFLHTRLHGFEAQLRDSVDTGDCQSVRVSRHGLYGPDQELGRYASKKFGAACTVAGPSVGWYHYQTDADVAKTLNGLRPEKRASVCVSRVRREVLAGMGVRNFEDLCAKRQGSLRLDQKFGA